MPVPFPKDPYEAIKQAYLDGTDTESEPFEDPIDTETPESPLNVAPPTSLPESTPPTLVPILRRTARMVVRVPPAMSSGLSASMAEVAAMSEFTFRKSVSEDTEDEDPTAEDEDPAAGDEGLAAGDEGLAMGVEGPSTNDERHDMDDESHGLDDEGHSVESDELGLEEDKEAVPVELALKEDHVYNTFEVGQGSGSAPKFERRKRMSASRQPILTTWTYLEDGMVYIDVPAYPPLAPPVQTPPSREWTSGSLLISSSPSAVPLPVSSPMIPLIVPSPIATPTTAETKGFLIELRAQVKMQGGLIRDHVVRLEELSPALFERYDREIRELFTRSGGVRDEIFSQRYRFRSLEHEQERTAMTFGALWRPVLTLEEWARHRFATRATGDERSCYCIGAREET
nr:hypothetical protein [Tanacetum cinerariifolium]